MVSGKCTCPDNSLDQILKTWDTWQRHILDQAEKAGFAADLTIAERRYE